MKNYSADQHVNIGSGIHATVLEFAELVFEIVCFRAKIPKDRKPEAPPRKLMANDELREMGWRPSTGPREGIETVYHILLQTAVPTLA